jgi:protein-disulfide isomerase
MKKYITALIVIGGLLAGTLAGVWLSRQRNSEASHSPQQIRNLSDASPGAENPQTKGSPQATVIMEEFADFQCPPCASLHGEIKKLESEYGSKIQLIFRHYPLSMHEQAVPAAQAAEAAALQGKFWEMHDLLYERQEEWSEKPNAAEIFTGFARSLNLDMEKFLRDMNDPQIKERIEADRQRGNSIELQGTPSLFINGREIPSESMTPEGIREAINVALK